MTIIQHKRGISSNWTSSDPVLAVSEIGYETDTGKFKIGDGASAWSALPYFSTSSGGSVTSVALTVPTGLTISGSPITTSGTLALSFDTGYSIPTTAKQTNWDTAYGWGNHADAGYQPGDSDLTAIAALSANGLLRKTAGTWGMDTATYLTSYTETDTLSDVTGRGATTNTAISITNATSSTNTTTGALKVTGGVGIQENLNVGGNVIVTGNLTVEELTVNGTTTTINSTIVTVDDPIFTLGGDTAPGSDDNKDRGIAFRWHNGVSAKIGFFGFDDSTQYFTFVPDATITNEVVSGSTGTISANLNGNATSANTLSTARNIWGQSFDGSADVTGSLTSVSDITSSDTTFSIGTTSVTTISGNAIAITGGTTSNTVGTGGSVSLTAGSATSSTGANFGGNVNIAAGASTLSASGTGGSVSILAGNGNTKGTISIGTSNTSGITIGASGITTTIAGTLSASLNALTISSPLSGTSYNGSSAVSIGLSSGYGDTQNPYGSKSINTILAGPAGGVSGSPTFRSLVSADIPDLSGTYLPLSGGTLSGAIAMGNNNITGVNALTISDPGTSEGILWAGGNLWKIYEAPDNLSNAAGNMQFVVDTTRVFTIDTSGNLNSVGGAITLGGTGTASSIKTLATTGTASGNLTISTGDTTTSGTSGNITIDVGNGATGDGTISIGNTYASAITIGRTGVDTTFAGQIESTHASTWSSPSIIIGGAQGAMLLKDTDSSQADALIGANGGNFYILGDTASDGTYDTTPFTINLTSGATTFSGDVAVNGGDLTTTSTGTATLFNTNATTLNIGGAATTISMGATNASVSVPGTIRSTYSSGSEGGEFFLATPASSTTIDTGVAIDLYQNKFRIFESGGTGTRGYYLDITDGTSGAGINLRPPIYQKIINATAAASSLGTVVAGASTTYSAFGTNGVALKASTAYEVECLLLLTTTATSTSGTPATLAVALGSPSGAAVPTENQLYYTYSASTTVLSNAAAVSGVHRVGTTTFASLNTITIGTGTTNYLRAFIKGIVRINTAGNLTLRLAYTGATTGNITAINLGAGSYIKFTELGSNTVTNIGTWA